ncbi:hypothetical protein BDY21DRAFT_212358 [Lineolata rhizophorae]|uniref:NACHT domain-containing protein n=1 Tax=Lineolata rhizophorae TaxID=578093 RepID=A0A6A6P479_9PEZI|nr:hypothetical protein BDY21DRAFT_212358 [Lineolata rhizophorae]
MGSNACPQVRLLFKDAFDKLEGTIRAKEPNDCKDFKSTTLRDVHDAARKIERELGARQSLRNMRRIQPFLDGLEQYSKAIEVLCNGTDYLPWIWAPVKLILIMASQYTAGIEKIVATYASVAEALPRFDLLGEAFKSNADFQRLLAAVYVDILEFHRCAYDFFKNPGVKMFFKTLWAGFDRRFKGILDSLTYHSELVEKRANAQDIYEAQKWRERRMAELERDEQKFTAAQLQEVLAWLEVHKDYEQENELERQYSLCHEHTCDWIQRNSVAKSWLRLSAENLVVWLNGKPGAGKSVLASILIRFLQRHRQITVLYFWCNYYSSASDKSCHILRTFVAQFLRQNKGLAAYVYDNYIQEGRNSSVLELKDLIQVLLSSAQASRIVVDGLDELPYADQRQVLLDLLPLASVKTRDASSSICKIIFTSRDIPQISKQLGRRPQINLNKEKEQLRVAIQLYVQHRLAEIQGGFQNEEINCEEFADIEARITARAGGMFLWVRLVLQAIENSHCLQDLRDTVESLPSDLEKLYLKLLENVFHDRKAEDRDITVRILEWVAFAKRPMRKHEIITGISLRPGIHKLTNETRLWDSAMDLAKPFIEEGATGFVSFVHFTVQEFLIKRSGNFLDPISAHRNISSSCVAYLTDGLELLDDSKAEQNISRVVKGFHALCLYSHEHWIAHLFEYAKLNNGIDGPDSEVLCQRMIDFESAHEISAARHTSASDSPRIDVDYRRLCVDAAFLRTRPITKGIVEEVRNLRIFMQSLPCTTGRDAEAQELSHDMTVLTAALQKYNSIVHRILEMDNVPRLDRQALARFKEQNAGFAFVCRFRGCPHATVGFSSNRKRTDHETLHTGLARSNDESLSTSSSRLWNTTGINGKRAKDGSPVSSNTKPKRIRRNAECNGTVPAKHFDLRELGIPKELADELAPCLNPTSTPLFKYILGIDRELLSIESLDKPIIIDCERHTNLYPRLPQSVPLTVREWAQRDEQRRCRPPCGPTCLIKDVLRWLRTSFESMLQELDITLDKHYMLLFLLCGVKWVHHLHQADSMNNSELEEVTWKVPTVDIVGYIELLCGPTSHQLGDMSRPPNSFLRNNFLLTREDDIRQDLKRFWRVMSHDPPFAA